MRRCILPTYFQLGDRSDIARTARSRRHDEQLYIETGNVQPHAMIFFHMRSQGSVNTPHSVFIFCNAKTFPCGRVATRPYNQAKPSQRLATVSTMPSLRLMTI